MFTKTIKQTSFAILAAVTLSIGSVGLSTSAQASSLDIQPFTVEKPKGLTIANFNGNNFNTRGSRTQRSFFKSKSRSSNKGFKLKKK